MIRVEESVIVINMGAFSSSPLIKLNSWDDLMGTHYKIAYMYAYYIIEKEVTKHADSVNIVYVNDWKEGLLKLTNKSIDIYIGVERTVIEELKNKQIPIYQAGVLERTDLYPYFNKKHKVLADRLATLLKEMKTDGTIDKILSSY